MDLPDTIDELWSFLDKLIHYQLFTLKETPVTLASILIFIVFVMAFYVASRLIDRLVMRKVLPRFRIDTGIQFTLRRVTQYTIMIVGALISFQFVGIDLSGLAVIFGLLSVGIGFGLQNITSNFISGLILLFERPIKVGDRVTVGQTEGDVLSINMRSTTIRTINNISIIVPNSEFVSKNVTNWSHGDPKIRLDIEVGVSYKSDLDTVIKALEEVAEDHSAVLDHPRPDVLLKSFGDSSWNMILRCWIVSPERHHLIRSQIHMDVVRKFAKYDVEIPYPQRDVHVRSPLPVPLATKEAGPEDLPPKPPKPKPKADEDESKNKAS